MKIERLLLLAGVTAVLGAPIHSLAQDGEATDLDQLLNYVEEGAARDRMEEETRVLEVEQNQANQQQLLNEIQAAKASEEARSARLETTFEENELPHRRRHRSAQRAPGFAARVVRCACNR